VEADATLALQGDNAYELFVIEEGEAEVRRDGETIATLREGDVFGEIGVLVTGTRRATVVATTPMRLVAMFSRDFRQIDRQMPAVSAKLREIMRERVTRTSL
jgi:CRP-like cAMP-binding protein